MAQKAISKIIHRPFDKHIDNYEKWLKEIIPVAGAFDGHKSVSIIRPHGANKNYTIILHFESANKLNAWLGSEERKTLIDAVQPYLEEEEKIEIETGFEFWFTPETSTKMAPPYKQFLATSSAIYPLTLVVPKILSAVFSFVGIAQWQMLQGLLSVLLIVGLMVYVIMPRYTRLLSKWLYN